MLKAFQTAVNLQNWDLERRPTLLAISGGSDSVALARLFALSGYPFAMAHVNFGLRGKESDLDEHFVRVLALELGVEVFVEHANVVGYRKQNGLSIQMAARDLRYSFFHRLMKDHGFEKLATAHHANDNLEHFFMYLHRGNSAVAWRGIWADQGDVLRPLLGFLKGDLTDFLLEQGCTWREDRSNASVGYLRNRVRHYVMPGMDEFAREFYNLSIAQQSILQVQLAADEHLWQRLCTEGSGGVWIPSTYQDQASEIDIYRRMMGFGLSRSQVEQLLKVKQAGKRFEGSEKTVWVGRNGWMVTNSGLESPSAVPMEWKSGNVIDWGRYRIEIQWVESAEFGDDCYCFDGAVANKSWVIRGWVNGDDMVVFGGKRQKLSDLLVNDKIESFVKPTLPLLVGSEGVLCALSVRRSGLYAVESGAAGCWSLRWTVIG